MTLVSNADSEEAGTLLLGVFVLRAAGAAYFNWGSVMKLVCLCIFGSLIAVAGCSSGSSAPTTVHAQSGYSAASLSGTYAFELVQPFDKGGGPFSAEIGTIGFDGSGNVNGGSLTIYFANSTQTCSYTLSGTYTVQTSGAGTAALTLTPAASQPSGCTVGTGQIALEVAASGDTVQFVGSDGNISGGTATKQ